MVTDTKRIEACLVKAPRDEGEVALMDVHKQESREVGEGVEIDIQNKCARGRGQGYGIKCVGICQRKSASVWKRGLKDASPGKRAGV